MITSIGIYGLLGLIFLTGFGAAYANDDPKSSSDVPVVLSPQQIAKLNDGPYAESGDAGDLPLNAQTPIGSGALTAITGILDNDNDVDMFKICISDVNTFEAITGFRDFDTQLSLFRTNGDGVMMNDDNTPPGPFGSRIDNQPTFAPQIPGYYLLAMTSFDNDATDGGVEMDLVNAFEFGQEELTGTIDGWSNFGGGSGNYQIIFTGVSFDACDLVGGDSLSIDTAALLLAGAQTNAAWLLSALAVIGSVAFGALYITTKRN